MLKTPRERAIEIAHRISWPGLSRKFFVALLDDDGEAAKNARELVRVLEQEITRDRRDVAAESAPS